MIFRNFFQVLFNKPHEARKVLNRADWLGPINNPSQPFLAGREFQVLESAEEKSIMILPLPSINRITSIWHTVGFVFGWKFIKNQIDFILRNQKSFYYLLHSADFLGIGDQDKRYQHSLYRMKEPLQNKIEYLETIFNQLSQYNRPIVTMYELACYYYEKAGVNIREVCHQK
jgi:hypothetical protein